MIKRTLLGLAAFGLCFATLAAAQPQTVEPAAQPSAELKTLSLSLDDCILKSMKNNLALAVQVMKPELSQLAVQAAKEYYLPSLSFAWDKIDTNSASYSFLTSQGTTTQNRGDYSAQVNQNLPLGGNIYASLTAYNIDSNANFQTINPRYGTTLTFNFTQPLLQNFGPEIGDRNIIIARNNRDISDYQFLRYVQTKIYEVEQDYWNLVYAIENLKVEQQSLALAQELLEKNKRSVEIGTMAPMEVLSAEAEVAARQADILGGQALVKTSEDTLRRVINLEAEMADAQTLSLIPSSVPTSDPHEVSYEDSFSKAMANRPDLAASRVDIKLQEFNLTVARNQLLPNLSLNAQYWSPGVSGTQLIYLNNNPLTGIVIGSIAGGASQAFNDTFAFKYNNWSVGLTLSLPLSTVFSRAAEAEARVNLDQSKLSLKDQEQQLSLDVRNAVLAVRTNYQSVQAYKVAQELARQKLEAEQERLKVGLSTNYTVLQYQRDYATQQGLELKAIIDYNNSLANLETVEGLSLRNKKIEISQWLKR
jgi:outer membrane protein TolC